MERAWSAVRKGLGVGIPPKKGQVVLWAGECRVQVGCAEGSEPPERPLDNVLCPPMFAGEVNASAAELKI